MVRTKMQHILRTASQIVQRDGVAHLTIDAVAREANLSKGGVLYHFPSKEALVSGMIMEHLRNFSTDLEKALTDENPGPGQWLRSYLRASDASVHQDPDPVVCLIAAIATNPELLGPLRERFALWQKQSEEDGLPPALATIIRLAVDGLWFADLFGLAAPERPMREEVLRTLRAMASPLSAPDNVDIV
jgi:AcrR family transcriptional regulator